MRFLQRKELHRSLESIRLNLVYDEAFALYLAYLTISQTCQPRACSQARSELGTPEACRKHCTFYSASFCFSSSLALKALSDRLSRQTHDRTSHPPVVVMLHRLQNSSLSFRLVHAHIGA